MVLHVCKIVPKVQGDKSRQQHIAYTGCLLLTQRSSCPWSCCITKERQPNVSSFQGTQQSPWACALYRPKHTLPHTHASPRSNSREYAPCTIQNTHSHTCIHGLAAIIVTMRLVRKNTQTSTRMHSLRVITRSIRPAQAQPNTFDTHMNCLARMVVSPGLFYLAKKNITYAFQVFMYTALGVYESQELGNYKIC
jgi:hypothetical protein